VGATTTAFNRIAGQDAGAKGIGMGIAVHASRSSLLWQCRAGGNSTRANWAITDAHLPAIKCAISWPRPFSALVFFSMNMQAGDIFRPTVFGAAACRVLGVAMLCLFAFALAVGSGSLLPIVLTGKTNQSLQPTTTSSTGPVPPATLSRLEHWAASPLFERSVSPFKATPGSTESSTQLDVQQRLGASVFAVGAIALLGSLLESLLYAVRQTTTRRRRAELSTAAVVSSRPGTEADYEAKCRKLFGSVTALWARAETAVFDLDEALPLRPLLFKELRQISQRLAMDPGLQVATKGAVTARHDQPFWRALSQRLNQSGRDLKRICAVAEAASAGFGSRSSEPRIPKTRDEACFILGASREADPETLMRLVKALRQCWHPDLAQTEQDRRHREARLKQINAAHDLIAGKRAEG
jgi:hypothetical protein